MNLDIWRPSQTLDIVEFLSPSLEPPPYSTRGVVVFLFLLLLGYFIVDLLRLVVCIVSCFCISLIYVYIFNLMNVVYTLFKKKKLHKLHSLNYYSYFFIIFNIYF